MTEGVTLELSHVEAIALKLIMERIGGDPKTSVRAVADKISAALTAAGYNGDQVPYRLSNELVMEKFANIYFVDGSLARLVDHLEKFERS